MKGTDRSDDNIHRWDAHKQEHKVTDEGLLLEDGDCVTFMQVGLSECGPS